jgi:hypothetical protein
MWLPRGHVPAPIYSRVSRSVTASARRVLAIGDVTDGRLAARV